MKKERRTSARVLKVSRQTRAGVKEANKRRLTLTVAGFFAGQVVSGGEPVFGHRHVGVKGQGEQA